MPPFPKNRPHRLRPYLQVLLTVAVSCGLGSLLFTSLAQPPSAVADDDDWTELEEPLPVELSGSEATFLAVANSIYVLGGDTNDGVSPIIYVASQPDNYNEEVTEWEDNNFLPIPVNRHSVVSLGRTVYVIGGYDGDVRYANIWRGDLILKNGLLGWRHIGDYPFPIVRHGAAIARIWNRDTTTEEEEEEEDDEEEDDEEEDDEEEDDEEDDNSRKFTTFMYVLGGLNALNQPLDAVQVTTVTKQSYITPTTFQPTNNLPKPLYYFATVVHNRYIYVIGGHDGASAQSSIFFSVIQDDGQLTPWVAIPPLPYDSFGHKAFMVKNYLFVVGGENSARKHKEIYYTYLDPISGYPRLPWTEYDTLPEPLVDFAATATSNSFNTANLYIVGGIKDEQRSNKVFVRPLTRPPDVQTACRSAKSKVPSTMSYIQLLPIMVSNGLISTYDGGSQGIAQFSASPLLHCP